jgi:hypothetical protein
MFRAKVAFAACLGFIAVGCSSAAPASDGEATGQTEDPVMTGCSSTYGHDVCIHIQGYGLEVQWASVTIFANGADQGWLCNPEGLLFWQWPGQSLWQHEHSTTGWVSGGNTCYYHEWTHVWEFNRTFPNDTKMCAQGWLNGRGFAGSACGTIHA